jgi:hypothetical protein
MLLWSVDGTSWPAALVPLAWSAVGTVAAVHLAVRADYGLAAGAAATLAVFAIRPARRSPAPLAGRPTGRPRRAT